MEMHKFVAYFRVSTARQGRSGLGLAAQRAAVNDLIVANDNKLIAEFQEVESGKNRDRPKLTAALGSSGRSSASSGAFGFGGTSTGFGSGSGSISTNVVLELAVDHLPPTHPLATLLESFDQADPATNFQSVLESPDSDVFSDEFERAARGSRIEREE